MLPNAHIISYSQYKVEEQDGRPIHVRTNVIPACSGSVFVSLNVSDTHAITRVMIMLASGNPYYPSACIKEASLSSELEL